MTTWMVRSGSGGRLADECREKGVVALGWEHTGDPDRFGGKGELQQAIVTAYPDYTEGQAASAASQLWRFKNELAPGDYVITYDSGARLYHYGVINGDARYDASAVEELAFQRPVKWFDKPIRRDDLSSDARNRLGSVLTLFKVPNLTAAELHSLATGQGEAAQQESSDLEEPSDVFAA